MLFPGKSQKAIKQTLMAVAGVIFLLAAVAVIRYRDAMFPDTHSWIETVEILRPHIRVYRSGREHLADEQPYGEEAAPVVIVFHGCEGMNEDLVNSRGQWLSSLGYIAVMVDSYKGRNVSAKDGCKGYRLWGNERAADVYSALVLVREMDNVDFDRVVLLGYSHGGWSILDALAYGGAPPFGASDAPQSALAGVKGAVTYYPYCSFPARMRKPWKDETVPVLSVHAGQDSVVDSAECISGSIDWRDQGAAIENILFPAVNHGFDIVGHRNYSEAERLSAQENVEGFLHDVLMIPGATAK